MYPLYYQYPACVEKVEGGGGNAALPVFCEQRPKGELCPVNTRSDGRS